MEKSVQRFLENSVWSFSIFIHCTIWKLLWISCLSLKKKLFFYREEKKQLHFKAKFLYNFSRKMKLIIKLIKIIAGNNSLCVYLKWLQVYFFAAIISRWAFSKWKSTFILAYVRSSNTFTMYRVPNLYGLSGRSVVYLYNIITCVIGQSNSGGKSKNLGTGRQVNTV